MPTSSAASESPDPGPSTPRPATAAGHQPRPRQPRPRQLGGRCRDLTAVAPIGATRPEVDVSALGQIERVAITRATVTIPSDVLDPDAPPVPLRMLDLRLQLLLRSTPEEVKDRAWRHLGGLARAQRGEEWNLFALGVAYPYLRAQVTRLVKGRTWQQAQQAHFDLAVEFLFALHRLDLDTPNVFARLTDAAYTHASGRKRRPEPWTYDVDQLPDRYIPQATDGVPDADHIIGPGEDADERAVLDRLVQQINEAPGRQRITGTQVTLITGTYLDGRALREVAAELGLSEPSASKQRRRAADLIAEILDRPHLASRTGR